MPEKNLAELIRKAGTTKRVDEFKCPYIPDFYVKLAYASKFILNQIREASREITTNLRTREKEERLNDEKLRQEYTRHIIVDWRGLTGEKLRKLIPGLEMEAEEELKKDIPYSKDVAVVLLEVSLEFENWVIGIATEIDNYTAVKEKEEDVENLS